MDSFLLDLDPLEDLPPLPLLTSPSSPLSLSTTNSLPSVSSDPSTASPPSAPRPPSPSPSSSPSPSELQARLTASLSENKALRTRVASLSRENRALRAQLRQSPSPSSTRAEPLYRAARAVANAVRISPVMSDDDDNNNNNNESDSLPAAPAAKRARTGASVSRAARPAAAAAASPAATTTMACALLLCGAFFSAPAILQSDSRTYAGAPAIPAGARFHARAHAPYMREPETRYGFTPRSHPALPAPDTPATPSASPALRRHSAMSVDYMLCEDGRETHRALSSCAAAADAPGRPCKGPPQIISLVVPAAAAGLNASAAGSTSAASASGKDPYPLAEVLCHVVSVSPLSPARAARIQDAVARPGARDVVGVVSERMGMGVGMGMGMGTGVGVGMDMGGNPAGVHVGAEQRHPGGKAAGADDAHVRFPTPHVVASSSASAAA